VQYGSIFLFINGFRIPPYGDTGNDWLGLDQRKAQGTKRNLGSRDIVGQIEILDENNDFQIISSREGVANNNSFRSLIRAEQNNSYFYKTMRRLERYVVEGLNWDSTIYDSQEAEGSRKFKEIEEKIISGQSTDSDLLYREDDKTKRRRIYESIHSIIAARFSDVLELYVNERLIAEKIEEERRISEREFEQLLVDFENKRIDTETLNKVLVRKAAQNAEIDRQLKEFARYGTIDEATLKAIIELENLKKTNENQASLIQNLQLELSILKEEKEQAEKIAKTAKEETIKIKRELAETQSQNLFLKSIKSQDFNDIVNLMHQIGISVGTIQNYSKGIIFRLDQNIPINHDELKDVFSKLNHELNKIHSISKFATKANFKIETRDTTLNVINFIEEYLLNIAKPFLSGKITLIVYEHGAKEFLLSFKPIELIIILDNLVSNSKKSLSSKEREGHDSSFEPKIEVSMEVKNGDLNVSFRDNGVGISEENRDKVFDYGYTTTDGSGLGLTHVRELMKKMNGDIVLNPIFDAGAEFVLIFKKQQYE
jgi:signal transduction histidine kinase